MIATAVFVTAINISVFNIWVPARLQISERYICPQILRLLQASYVA
jgi:hypothetical protein